jgi:hypothetical protein
VTLRSRDASSAKRARLQFSNQRFQAGLRRYRFAIATIWHFPDRILQMIFAMIKKIQLRSVPPTGRGGRYHFDDAAKACIPMGTARR